MSDREIRLEMTIDSRSIAAERILDGMVVPAAAALAIEEMSRDRRESERALEDRLTRIRRAVERYLEDPGCNVNSRRTAMERLAWALKQSE